MHEMFHNSVCPRTLVSPACDTLHYDGVFVVDRAVGRKQKPIIPLVSEAATQAVLTTVLAKDRPRRGGQAKGRGQGHKHGCRCMLGCSLILLRSFMMTNYKFSVVLNVM